MCQYRSFCVSFLVVSLPLFSVLSGAIHDSLLYCMSSELSSFTLPPLVLTSEMLSAEAQAALEDCVHSLRVSLSQAQQENAQLREVAEVARQQLASVQSQKDFREQEITALRKQVLDLQVTV